MVNKPDINEIMEQEGIELKKKGRYYWGLCPLHEERTPSFMVDPARQTFRCFGCHAHGDGIQFIQDYRGLSFKAALAYLGISYDKSQKDSKADIKRKLIKNFRGWERRYHADLCTLFRTIQNHKARARNIADINAEAYQQEPLIEYRLDILESEGDKLKFALYVEVNNGGI
ncbi:MAG TPA: hypothetical protein DDX84_04210 [Nitrospiraceae bacterium]|nr:hypothetical protein [Nitrospiraceae bacterium]HKZ56588.1 CHC2 zinc finger domain-containing protein [Thermodesulfovibrionales bacterium]